MSVHWGQPNYSLPYRQEQTWTFRNNQTLSQSFRQKDWPLPGIPQRLQDYTWIYFPNVQTLIAASQKPFVQKDWPNPVPYPGPIIQNTIRVMSSTPGAPVLNFDFPNPQFVTGFGTWTENLLLSTLAPLTSAPFSQMDWPNPQTYTPLLQTYTLSLNPNIQPVIYPPFAWDYGNQTLEYYLRDWFQNLNETTLRPVIQAPFSQYDWPNPQPRQWYGDWEQALVLYTPQPLPFQQDDWPLPRTNVPIDQTWFNNLVSLLSLVVVEPFSQKDWPLPKTFQPIDQSWWQSLVRFYPVPPPPPIITSAGRQIQRWEVLAAEGFINAVREFGRKGGHARSHALTSDQRSAIASTAATTRWQK